MFLIYVKPTKSHGNILLCAGRYPELRSSLRKPGQRDSASLTSTSSSKKSVRLALGGEMTAVQESKVVEWEVVEVNWQVVEVDKMPLRRNDSSSEDDKTKEIYLNIHHSFSFYIFNYTVVIRWKFCISIQMANSNTLSINMKKSLISVLLFIS